MLKLKEILLSTIITIICVVAFVLMVEYSLNEELKVVEKQEMEYLKYIEDNKQEGIKWWKQ